MLKILEAYSFEVRGRRRLASASTTAILPPTPSSSTMCTNRVLTSIYLVFHVTNICFCSSHTMSFPVPPVYFVDCWIHVPGQMFCEAIMACWILQKLLDAFPWAVMEIIVPFIMDELLELDWSLLVVQAQIDAIYCLTIWIPNLYVSCMTLANAGYPGPYLLYISA